MTRPVEYAEQYTLKERLRFALIGASAGALLLGASRLWLFPWLEKFAPVAHCHTVLGVSGLTALWYGLFMGLPLLVFVFTSAFLGRRGVRVLKHAQMPPPGEKVFRPMIIRRGAPAKFIGAAHLGLVLASFLLVLWGGVQAGKMSETMRPDPSSCVSHRAPTGS